MFFNIMCRKSTYIETYSHLIKPNNGLRLWGEDHEEPLNPPFMRRAAGRPKTVRSKKNDEPNDPNRLRLRKHNKHIKCTRCGEFGHNKRTYIGKTATDRAIPVGGNKVRIIISHDTELDENCMRLVLSMFVSFSGQHSSFAARAEE